MPVATAQLVRLLLTRGNRLRFTVVVTSGGDPVDLTGYTPALQFRRHADSAMTLATLAPAVTDATGLSVVAAEGRVTVHLTPATTGAWTFRHAVFDLVLTSATDRLIPIRGELLVNESVTR